MLLPEISHSDQQSQPTSFLFLQNSTFCSPRTPSFPDADARSDRPECGGREIKFLQSFRQMQGKPGSADQAAPAAHLCGCWESLTWTLNSHLEMYGRRRSSRSKTFAPTLTATLPPATGWTPMKKRPIGD